MLTQFGASHSLHSLSISVFLPQSVSCVLSLFSSSVDTKLWESEFNKKVSFLNTSFHFRSFSQSFNVPKWHKNEVWLLRINPNMSFFPLSISLTHSPTHPVLSPHMKYRFRLVTCKMLFVDCIRRSRTKPRASGCKFTCKTCNFVSG